MKQLVIMRHAKAEKTSPSKEDFDRRLESRGMEEAAEVARMLKSYGVKPDFALVSAAARTQGTFEQVKGVMGDIPALVTKDLYNADAHKLRQAVELHEDDGACVLVIAHNPGVQYLVADYLNEGAASLDDIATVARGFPTAAAAVFAVDAAGRPVYDGFYVPE